VLEPGDNPAAQVFRQALKAQNIPLTAFEVSDLAAEYARLRGLGVAFVMEPTDAGVSKLAILDDTCGNLIQLYEVVAGA
jgi:glyoxylase I family protein